MNLHRITTNALAAVWHDNFPRVMADLGPGYEHLRCSRTAQRHGTRTAVLLCRISDDRQSEATLPRMFCGYRLHYDPVEFETTGHNWCLKFRVNTERLYFGKRDEVVQTLKRKLPRLCPPGFSWCPHPRQLIIEHQFSHHGSELEVVRSIHPKIVQLIKATYPVFDWALATAEESAWNKAQRRAFTRIRTKAYARAANKESPVDRRAFNRSIPPRLRAEVIRRNTDGRCKICRKRCSPDEIHIDHITSIANGGLTVLENLQVTCGACNLAKGSGRPRSEFAHVPSKVRRRAIR